MRIVSHYGLDVAGRRLSLLRDALGIRGTCVVLVVAVGIVVFLVPTFVLLGVCVADVRLCVHVVTALRSAVVRAAVLALIPLGSAVAAAGTISTAVATSAACRVCVTVVTSACRVCVTAGASGRAWEEEPLVRPSVFV